MGVWSNAPLEEVVFRLGYPVDFGLVDRVSEFQHANQYGGRIAVLPDEKQHGLAVPHYFLQDPQDEHFQIRITHTDAIFTEKRYKDWADFKAKILHHLAATPIPSITNVHHFIGLAYIDRLPIFPTQDKTLPLERYLSMNIRGPVPFKDHKFQRAEWLIDYQLERPNNLMRIEVKQEGPDGDGLEHLRIVIDRRIVGPDDTPVEAFLQLAHAETIDAFESMLEPNYLKFLKEGTPVDA